MNWGIIKPIGETLSYIIACFSASVYLILLPYSLIRIMISDSDNFLPETSFSSKFGELFREMRTRTITHRMFYIIFTIRRIIYMSVALINQDLPMTVQFLILLLMNLSSVIYQGATETQRCLTDRRIENFNELMICYTFILALASSSNMITSPELQFTLTWVAIAAVEVQIFVNIILILVMQIRSLRVLFIKYKAKAMYIFASLKSRFKGSTQ